jgi:hypothetical protein
VSVRLLVWIPRVRAPDPARGAAVFRRGSFGPTGRRSTVRCVVAPRRWLLTPCALRLGGPHLPRSRPLALLVAVWARCRALSARTGTSFARLAPGPEATHIARAARARACLRREQRGNPKRLPSAWGHGLATAVEDHPQTVRVRAVSRHPFTCCDGTRRRPRWWISAPRYPAAPTALRRPTSERGRCSSPTSATDARHAHLTDHSTPEVTPRFRGARHVRWSQSPSGRPGSRRRLTTRHELQPTPSRARRCGGCGCHPILPGSRSSRAHR